MRVFAITFALDCLLQWHGHDWRGAKHHGGAPALLVKAIASKPGVDRVSCLPMTFDQKYRPQTLYHNDPKFSAMVNYMERASADMPHAFRLEGDGVVVA